jgi:hypothetical protein
MQHPEFGSFWGFFEIPLIVQDSNKIGYMKILPPTALVHQPDQVFVQKKTYNDRQPRTSVGLHYLCIRAGGLIG